MVVCREVPGAPAFWVDATGVDGTGHNYVEWQNRSILPGETVTFVVEADVSNDHNGENFVTIDVIGECEWGCTFASVSDTAYIGYTEIDKFIPDPDGGATPDIGVSAVGIRPRKTMTSGSITRDCSKALRSPLSSP